MKRKRNSHRAATRARAEREQAKNETAGPLGAGKPRHPSQSKGFSRSTLQSDDPGVEALCIDFHTEIAERLLQLRAEMSEEWERCRRELSSPEEALVGDDCSSASVSSAFTARTLEHLSARIKEIDVALEKLSHGEYGTCEDCGRNIFPARLRFYPAAKRCIECQDKAERHQRQRIA
ncbi:MAG: TraR/DksA family transcriptional regulator [Phycisphaerales bacterium]|nr:MAG: TraR/DksA family transcriptional regulator [Phycisphaerales bacterium]